MRRLWVIALALGCGRSVPDYPLGPPGGGTAHGSGSQTGGDVDSGVDASMIAGRVCLLQDPRIFSSCAGSGADGITVMLGSQMATTGVDGSFVIGAPSGTNLVWNASGSAIVTSVMQLSLSTQIPAIAASTYGDMLTKSQATIDTTTQGAVIANVLQNNAPAKNASATVTPGSLEPVLYDDDADDETWDANIGTGAHGDIWAPGLAAGSDVSLAITNGSDTASVNVGPVPVVANAITFVQTSF